jgi:hypothetical protein
LSVALFVCCSFLCFSAFLIQFSNDQKPPKKRTKGKKQQKGQKDSFFGAVRPGMAFFFSHAKNKEKPREKPGAGGLARARKRESRKTKSHPERKERTTQEKKTLGGAAPRPRARQGAGGAGGCASFVCPVVGAGVFMLVVGDVWFVPSAGPTRLHSPFL